MMPMNSVTTVLLFLCVASNSGIAGANKFLGKVPVHLENNVEFEHALLTELEGSLGNEHRTFTEKRLAAIKKAVQPIFAALPKNENGKLERFITHSDPGSTRSRIHHRSVQHALGQDR